MNKHIEIVKKWLADPDSVTQEELKQNRADANAAYVAAAYAAAEADAVVCWVERYEALEVLDGN